MPMEWKDIKKEKPIQYKDILVLTQNGSVFRGRYLVTTFVRERNTSYNIYNDYVIVGEPEEIFLPHTKDYAPEFRELMKTITHWINFDV